MKCKFSCMALIACLAISALPQDLTSKFDGGKMRERVRRLSSDEFEGRGPGTEGGRKATQYIADEFKAAGAKPANRGTYFQNVRLVGVKADHATKLRVGKTGEANGKLYSFGDDFVGMTGAQTGQVNVNAEIVFVGYGIDAPLYKWNDYKGPASDYKGKVLMMLVNDPPATPDEPDLFGGRALTYYGRWTYKYEEAARRGAVGVILIHTTES
ncbi:MAG: peptidase M28, partial [Pyrinomonadaceae bacterium]